MSSAGYCAVCRVKTHGPGHWLTKSHADRLWHQQHPRVKRQRFQRVRYADMWAREAASHIKIRHHRRRRPEDGPRFVVPVKEHWRGLPPGAHRRRRRRRRA